MLNPPHHTDPRGPPPGCATTVGRWASHSKEHSAVLSVASDISAAVTAMLLPGSTTPTLPVVRDHATQPCHPSSSSGASCRPGPAPSADTTINSTLYSLWSLHLELPDRDAGSAAAAATEPARLPDELLYEPVARWFSTAAGFVGLPSSSSSALLAPDASLPSLASDAESGSPLQYHDQHQRQQQQRPQSPPAQHPDCDSAVVKYPIQRSLSPTRKRHVAASWQPAIPPFENSCEPASADASRLEPSDAVCSALLAFPPYDPAFIVNGQETSRLLPEIPTGDRHVAQPPSGVVGPTRTAPLLSFPTTSLCSVYPSAACSNAADPRPPPPARRASPWCASQHTGRGAGTGPAASSGKPPRPPQRRGTGGGGGWAEGLGGKAAAVGGGPDAYPSGLPSGLARLAAAAGKAHAGAAAGGRSKLGFRMVGARAKMGGASAVEREGAWVSVALALLLVGLFAVLVVLTRRH